MKNSWFMRWFYLGAGKLLGMVATIWAFAAKPPASKYDLSHLVQYDSQHVVGPVQDDEALFLFAVVRGMHMRAILEVGGLSGFSALNFLRALPRDEGCFVATVDVNPVRKAGRNHETMQTDAGKARADDFLPLFEKYSLPPRFDMIFFDAHVYEEQTALLKSLKQAGLVDGKTIIALHDTFLYPCGFIPGSEFERDNHGDEGYAGFPEERRMVQDLIKDGYYPFQLHPRSAQPGNLAFRHGVTIMQLPQAK